MNKLFVNAPDICTEFRDRIGEYRNGTLPEDLFLRFETHRVECARCTKVLYEEERVAELMTNIEPLKASDGFRDRVLRAYRLKKDSVKDIIPQKTVRRVQWSILAFVAILLLLPMVRHSLYLSASKLTDAIELLPEESRHGIPVTFEIPQWAEIHAWVQVWQGQLFESMGELGSIIAPWSGWLWVAVIVSIVIGAINFNAVKSKLSSHIKKQEM